MEKAAARRAKGQKKRKATVALASAARKDRHEWREKQFAHHDSPIHQLEGIDPSLPMAEDVSGEVYQHILDQLRTAGLTWGSFVEWVSDPTSPCEASLRYEGFFRDRAQVQRVLGHWTSWRNCASGRVTVDQWAIDRVKHRVTQEGNAVTKSHLLQSHSMVIDKSFVLNFDLPALYEQLVLLCPTLDSKAATSS